MINHIVGVVKTKVWLLNMNDLQFHVIQNFKDEEI